MAPAAAVGPEPAREYSIGRNRRPPRRAPRGGPFLLTPEDAWKLVDATLEPLPAVSVPRSAAVGRVLAEALGATVDVPAQDVSAMDGYAVGPTVEAGTPLPVGGRVTAGDPPGAALRDHGALRIMTGAPLPAGADRVIPVERTDDGDAEVVLTTTLEPWANVRRRREVIAAGDPLLPAGTLLAPGTHAWLATHGHETVRVRARPRVAVLTTGDEVVPPSVEPAPGQLRDSHTPFLTAALATLGIEAEPLGIAPDRPRELAELVADGLGRDLLLLCGGVSKGEHDFVAATLDELACETVFHGVAMQPGKPLLAARHAGGWLLGLPGNPNSVMATFWLFARPLLRRLAGRSDGFWHGTLEGVLDGPLPGAKGRDKFLSARVRLAGGAPRVTPLAPVGSHDLSAFAHGSALVRIRAHAPEAETGEACEILPLADWLES